MRFWKGFIGLLSLGKVVGQNEVVVFAPPAETSADDQARAIIGVVRLMLLRLIEIEQEMRTAQENIIESATAKFTSSSAGIDVKRACFTEMIDEGVKTGYIDIELSSKNYLPSCFEVFSAEDKPANSGESEELEILDSSEALVSRNSQRPEL